MTLTVKSNISSLIVQRNFQAATTSLNTAIERMTTGYKINNAKDNAAGYSIATNWETQLSSLDIAAQNIAMGTDMLTTTEDNYDLIVSHLQRVRDLTEQAANGTYDSTSLTSIGNEITARLNEIDRISKSAEYNGKPLMSASAADVVIQVGITSTAANSQITLSRTLFDDATAKKLFGGTDEISAIVTKCTGSATASGMLSTIDDAIKTISDRVTALGAAQNRLSSAEDANSTKIQNLTSSLSTIKDADIAVESSNYIQAQILQQAAATLLATANQAPSIAMNLI